MVKVSEITEPYFSHDISTRCDEKILKMFFGFRRAAKEMSREELESFVPMAAYGVFWSIVEYMHRNILETKDTDVLADDLRISEKFIKMILDEYGLFRQEDDKYISDRILRNINKQEEKDKLEQENAANSIEEIEYSNIKTITLTEFERMILEKKEFTVLVASSTCYPCLTYEPIINEVYEERETTIYRINISMLTENEITRFRTYYAFKLTPTIFTIKDGIAAFEKTGSSTKEELIDWLDKNV